MAEIPSISVIISKYGDDKYLGELLNSLAVQKFKDFEIIILNDSPTVKTYEALEDYRSRAYNQITIMKKFTKEEGSGIRRNRGVEMACGDYILFMDSDEVLKENALETFYNYAQKYEAQVVYTENNYISSGVGGEFKNNIEQEEPITEEHEPEFLPGNFLARITDSYKKLKSSPTFKFVSREFLIRAGIKFKNFLRSEELWNLELILLSGRFLKVSDSLIIQRKRDEFAGVKKEELFYKKVLKNNDRLINGLNYLEEFLNRFDVCKAHPEINYALISEWIINDLQKSTADCWSLQPYAVYEVFKKDFAKDMGEQDVLISLLMSNAMSQMKAITNLQEKIDQKNKELENKVIQDTEVKSITPPRSSKYNFVFAPDSDNKTVQRTYEQYKFMFAQNKEDANKPAEIENKPADNKPVDNKPVTTLNQDRPADLLLAGLS